MIKNTIKNKNKAPENVAYYVYGGVFMQKNEQATCEAAFLQRLSQLEDLAEKKLKIYSRLLTDTALAKDMETLSARHKKRKESRNGDAFPYVFLPKTILTFSLIRS